MALTVLHVTDSLDSGTLTNKVHAGPVRHPIPLSKVDRSVPQTRYVNLRIVRQSESLTPPPDTPHSELRKIHGWVPLNAIQHHQTLSRTQGGTTRHHIPLNTKSAALHH